MNLRISPAFEKNHQPIKETLTSILPDSSVILEVGSGPGQHAAFFSEHVPQVAKWYPTERAMHLDAIRQWRAHANQPGYQSPQEVELLQGQWWTALDVPVLDAIVSVNVAHIVEWAGTCSLLEGAASLLKPGGIVYFYGPWRYRGRPLEPSNERFDLLIQERVPGGGLREVDALIEVAQGFGLSLVEDREMPSNNRSIWFQK